MALRWLMYVNHTSTYLIIIVSYLIVTSWVSPPDPDDPRTFPTDEPPPSFVSNARSAPTSKVGGHNPVSEGYSEGGSVVYIGVPEV